MNSSFKNQVDLLIDVIEYILPPEEPFVLKGGTAINLFYQNMPRLSVDIDIAFTEFDSREQFLSKLQNYYRKILTKLNRFREVEFYTSYTKDNIPKQLRIIRGNAIVKVDINLVIRGVVHPSHKLKLCNRAEDIFQKSVRVKVASEEDIFAGKFCAALDRQHPRDLFDVKLFLENNQINEKLKKTFLVYLISHNRPIHELLRPNLLDIKELYRKEFSGMCYNEPNFKALLETRENLIESLNSSLETNDKEFLISFKKGMPKWELLGNKAIKEMPAIKWKQFNINKMNKAKHQQQLSKLYEIL